MNCHEAWTEAKKLTDKDEARATLVLAAAVGEVALALEDGLSAVAMRLKELGKEGAPGMGAVEFLAKTVSVGMSEIASAIEGPHGDDWSRQDAGYSEPENEDE